MFIQFQNDIHCVIQKDTVMADDHHCAFKLVDPRFQPVQHGNIQVIGRLIQKQQARDLSAAHQPALSVFSDHRSNGIQEYPDLPVQTESCQYRAPSGWHFLWKFPSKPEFHRTWTVIHGYASSMHHSCRQIVQVLTLKHPGYHNNRSRKDSNCIMVIKIARLAVNNQRANQQAKIGMFPESAFTLPMRICRRVLLPLPLIPINPQRSPGLMVKDMFCNTGVIP